MKSNNQIKEANRKAMPKFLLILFVCTGIGGVIGFFSAEYEINTLAGSMKMGGEFFGIHVAPWLMLAVAIILPGICIPFFYGAKKLFNQWDGENEDLSDAIEQKLSVMIWISGVAIIMSYFLLAASYSGGFATFENKNNKFAFFLGIVAFLAIMVEVLIIQQKCVDTTKKINPEKTASVYDMKFQKKWMDSCDEAEKIMIGKCAFKAYSVTNTACLVFSVILALGALLFDIGFLPSLIVCIIWGINQSAYCKEALKYSKKGAKI